MQINSVSNTSFGLKFDSYMRKKLNESKKAVNEIHRKGGKEDPTKWEEAKNKLQSTLSDDYKLCLVPTDFAFWNYDIYLTSDKFNGYNKFLCKKISEDIGCLHTKQLNQLTEKINAIKAGNDKYYGPNISVSGPIIFVKDEK